MHGLLQLLKKESLPAWDTTQPSSMPIQPEENGNLHIPVPSRSETGPAILLSIADF